MPNKIVVDYSPYLDIDFSIEFLDGDVLVEGESYGEKFSFFDPGVMVFDKNGDSRFSFNLYDDFDGLQYDVKRELLEFEVMQVGLVRACVISRRGLQMFFSNKVLLWLMVDFLCSYNANSSDVVRLLGMKRQEIVKFIAGEAVAGSVSFLKKILLFEGNRFELDVVKASLIKPDLMAKFRHWDSVPIQAVYVSDRRGLVSGAIFLKDFFERNRVKLCHSLEAIGDLYKIAEDTVRLGESLSFKNAKKLVVKCKSEADLKRLHDAWVIKMNKSKEFYDPDLNFPECSLPENDHIVWISSANQLIEEARFMKNCAAVYVEKAASGNSVLFSVLYPERATLELKKNDGKYHISEIKAGHNQDVSKETFDYVREWMSY
ncbi:hypothetical protein HCU01_42340 [Halomonas cupida]|uniref:PcfJ-like protein n=1 Tax=Halomonas cupida TaxID=44933 RepID=A0A1M7HAW3_9GAMM|nr:PcfJ domain-containing protein [Halomonas cupida]GEN26285.1 hypothetical protein HCU01_42340 [Halomonas cupida]SHM25575.1 hypothetical protein SAMN05660971_02556 [Halomonas cupida]